MLSPWGEIGVSDAHVHFFSHRFFASLAAQRSSGGSGDGVAGVGALLGWQMPPERPEEFAAVWAGELDRHGVRRAALIASVHADEDSVAAAVERFPGRFSGYFMLNPCAPDGHERARRAVLDRGLTGICLFPAMHRYSIQDERVAPVLDVAAARPGTIVFVHCGVLTVGVRSKLGLPSPFDLKFSNPVDLHAVALRYPAVPFVIPHFGAGYFREALMVADLCPNCFLDTSSTNSWMRYQEPGCDLKSVFRHALDVLGPRRLLFGTDSSFFPRGWHREIFDRQAAALHELGVSDADAQAIFGENLEKLLARQP